MDEIRHSPLRICYSPALLPDELVYSYLARIAVHNGLDKIRYYPRFFGTRSALPILDLPTNLMLLQEQLGGFSPFDSASDLIERATIYPYHRAFLSPARHEIADSILRQGSGIGLKAALGRLANRFGANPALRYCPGCIGADITNHGSPYWHRAHQLPGVVACFKHGQNLFTLTLPHKITHKTKLFLPPAEGAWAPQCISDKRQIDFACLSTQVLQAGLAPQLPKNRAARYRDAAISQGFGTRGKLDYISLATAIRQHYGDFASFMHEERLLSTTKTPLCWVRTLIERPERSSHPICHLIFIGFIFRSLENFATIFAPPRENAHEEHHVRCFDERTCLRTNDHALLADAGRSCRALAAELNLSVSTVVLRRRRAGIPISERPKVLTVLRQAEIADRIKLGISSIEIARLCDVSLATVYRQRKIHQSEVDHASARMLRQEKINRRREWMEAIALNSAGSLRSIRISAQATYAWLYRNDRFWLLDSCAKLHRTRPSRTTVDWSKRDTQMCEKLKAYVVGVRANASRPRISQSLMTNQLGDAMVRANRHLLPKLFALLEELEEPPFSYQLYRIDRAVEIIVEEKHRRGLWRVRRLAGMRKWTPTHHVYARWKLNTMS